MFLSPYVFIESWFIGYIDIFPKILPNIIILIFELVVHDFSPEILDNLAIVVRGIDGI